MALVVRVVLLAASKGFRIHDLVEIALDRGAVRHLHLGQDVADLVRPAALHRDRGVDDGPRRAP